MARLASSAAAARRAGLRGQGATTALLRLVGAAGTPRDCETLYQLLMTCAEAADTTGMWAEIFYDVAQQAKFAGERLTEGDSNG